MRTRRGFLMALLGAAFGYAAVPALAPKPEPALSPPVDDKRRFFKLVFRNGFSYLEEIPFSELQAGDFFLTDDDDVIAGWDGYVRLCVRGPAPCDSFPDRRLAIVTDTVPYSWEGEIDIPVGVFRAVMPHRLADM